ncbi:Fasciclin-like arabinogalactan protein 2 [Vitis vinifera]|uniref:Fasciclin-like arabinogalactan protein 2 n=1 Tax=Vitis vinifera TaxID=29760 RepID=A0A438K0F5_VITVI|nr:Fasciclin-like arabinogalactan protein 2 [Vitis vinifera]
MQLLPGSARTLMLSLSALLLLLCCATEAHNITSILAKNPEFSTFNHYLTVTHLANEINLRETITVCAVDNPGMSDLLAKGLSIYAIKNVLSLHILLDYFGAKKLHQITNGTALAATMYQATGSAPDPPASSTSLISKGASKILPSEEAEAPTPGPSEQNLTALMSAHGCKVFADTLVASDAQKTYEDNLEGGLTVFCPMDDVFKSFLPKYKNLTADGKLSLLLYHGIPVYQSLSLLKSSNGVMNTLATDGAKKYDFTVQNDGEVVTLKTKIVTARMTGTLLDEQPLGIFTIDKVLLPKELFKAEAPAPAPHRRLKPMLPLQRRALHRRQSPLRKLPTKIQRTKRLMITVPSDITAGDSLLYC